MKMELITIKSMPREAKIELLKQLGCEVDKQGIVTKDNEPVIDKYINAPVRLDNMIIFPGSTIILDDNSLSIASYMEEFGEL